MLYVASTIISRTSLGFVKLKVPIAVFEFANTSVRKFSEVLTFIDDLSCKLFIALKKESSHHVILEKTCPNNLINYISN